jgi:hypothetical protein
VQQRTKNLVVSFIIYCEALPGDVIVRIYCEHAPTSCLTTDTPRRNVPPADGARK